MKWEKSQSANEIIQSYNLVWENHLLIQTKYTLVIYRVTVLVGHLGWVDCV